jgi:hypothetical protein
MERGTQTFVDAQKRLIEFAEQQAEAAAKRTSEPNGAQGSPLAAISELSRKGLESFVEAQKQFLDMIAQQAASATDRWKERAGQANAEGTSAAPASDLMGMARQSFDNYMNVQRQFAETATRAMSDWTRAFQTGGSGQPGTTLQDLTRQGVEAFINTQRTLLDITFRSMNPGATR